MTRRILVGSQFDLEVAACGDTCDDHPDTGYPKFLDQCELAGMAGRLTYRGVEGGRAMILLASGPGQRGGERGGRRGG